LIHTWQLSTRRALTTPASGAADSYALGGPACRCPLLAVARVRTTARAMRLASRASCLAPAVAPAKRRVEAAADDKTSTPHTPAPRRRIVCCRRGRGCTFLLALLVFRAGAPRSLVVGPAHAKQRWRRGCWTHTLSLTTPMRRASIASGRASSRARRPFAWVPIVHMDFDRIGSVAHQPCCCSTPAPQHGLAGDAACAALTWARFTHFQPAAGSTLLDGAALLTANRWAAQRAHAL
jgi:hypothetical protein